MKKLLFLLTATFLFLAAVSVAHANSIVPSTGEILGATVTATQTSGPNCCKTASLLASFTLGTMIPSTTDWNVTAFVVSSGALDSSSSGCHFGQTACSSLVWTLSSLFFDASNDTLSGTASTPFTGSGGDSRQVTLFFVDGVTSNLQYTNNDLTDASNDKPGVFSYTVSPVPEPSSLLLFTSGALGLAAVLRRKLRA